MQKKHFHLGTFLLTLGVICLAIYGALLFSGEEETISLTEPTKTSRIDIPLNGSSFAASLDMGVVELSVQDIEKMTKFYHESVGFDIISTGTNLVNLGSDGEIFLRLIEEKDYTFPTPGSAGLYHVAITHNSRKDLATRLYTLISESSSSYQGSADHTATEAFYFVDPEGNGLELYYDRPRTEWKYTADGKPIMGSTYIDTEKYIEKYKDIPVSGGETQMGHVHLKVGNISEARSFYQDILLFEVMNDTGTALFISRDGYHHHLGMNTWESLGAGVRNSRTYGLRSYELIYSNDMYEKIRNNLTNSKLSYKEEGTYIILDDPWGNTIKIRQE